MQKQLDFESWTHYQYVHFTNAVRDYAQIMPDVLKEWNGAREASKKKYYPHVSVGWDNNPRYVGYMDYVTINNTPEEFERALREAKAFSDTYNKMPLIVINSWNEWTETSYLEPDNKYGYGYLEAIKRVFKEE